MPIHHKKECPFESDESINKIDYKDIPLLSRYVSEYGRITPSRISGASRKSQKSLTQAIKRAKIIGLLHFSGNN